MRGAGLEAGVSHLWVRGRGLQQVIVTCSWWEGPTAGDSSSAFGGGVYERWQLPVVGGRGL